MWKRQWLEFAQSTEGGKQTEEDVLLEFLDTFEAAYAVKHGESKTRDGKVSLDEFVEYY